MVDLYSLQVYLSAIEVVFSSKLLFIDNLNVIRSVLNLFQKLYASCVYNLASSFDFLNTIHSEGISLLPNNMFSLLYQIVQTIY